MLSYIILATLVMSIWTMFNSNTQKVVTKTYIDLHCSKTLVNVCTFFIFMILFFVAFLIILFVHNLIFDKLPL